MKFYESGDNRKPVIFLFPGTCCLYSSFDHVLDGLHSYFYTVAVSYDGFDPNEKTEFYSMEDECEKIADDFAIDFADWIRVCILKRRSYDFENVEELLKIYKEEKDL